MLIWNTRVVLMVQSDPWGTPAPVENRLAFLSSTDNMVSPNRSYPTAPAVLRTHTTLRYQKHRTEGDQGLPNSRDHVRHDSIM